MGSRRTLILVGAILVGAIAGLLVMRYVSGVEDRANGENEMVSVVVVAADIPKGATVDSLVPEGLLIMDERRQKDVPSGAIRSIDDITGQVAAIDLPAGDIVTATKFVSAADSGSSSAGRLDPGQVAVSISVDQVHGVGNMVQPGDYVNMLIGLEPIAVAMPGEEEVAVPDAELELQGMAHLFQKVLVLAVGTSFGETVTDAEGNTVTPEASGLLTLAVPPEASQLIALAQTKGSIYLTLVRSDYEPLPIPEVWEPFGEGPLVPGTPIPGVAGQTPEDNTAFLAESED